MSIFRTLVIILFLFPVGASFGQGKHSVHEAHQEKFEKLGPNKEAEWDSIHGITAMPERGARSCSLQRIVYGWHPHWMGSAYSNYRWDLLSHFSYFSYEVDPNSGYPTTTNNWLGSSAVTAAQNNCVKTDLCVTLFSNHSSFFSSSTAQQNLIDTLISLVQKRNANGVNIDFEKVPSSEASAYNDFLVDLATQMHNQIPGSEVSVALFSVDWNNIFDIALLDQHLDHFVIMGYGYYYSGSPEAGPTAPLYDFGGSTRNLSRTVNQYLKEGASRSKLVLGLPYYGYEWETASGQIPESTTNTGTSKTYTTVRDNANGHYSNANKGWHSGSRSNYFVFQDGGNWHQCFTDLSKGLDERLDLILQRDLGGMGIWALGYDDGYTAFWNEIESHLTDCRTVPCSDTLYDMGGPDAPYNNDEQYAHTIDPSSNGNVELRFESFDIEAGFDSLWIYDGPDTNAALIGAYSGSSGPGTVISSGEALTIEFMSDGATVKPGWSAVWKCLPDTLAPWTSLDTLPEWVSKDFKVNFSDTDQTGGSGIEKGHYSVQQKPNNSWRGNPKAGFLYDAFEQAALHSDWTVDTGTWQLNGGTLHQSDEALSNTNVHASLEQDRSDRYLYHWKMRMSGSGGNRRAGLHYFCDSAEMSNRGNSYFAWFRLDDDKIQLYRVVNNSWGTGPVKEVSYAFKDGQWYDFKLSFDRKSGKTSLYVNDTLEARWKDPNPHASGNAISFRSGNAEINVERVQVFRSRDQTVKVPVGPEPTSPLRYQNQGPNAWAGRIASIATDSTGNISGIAKDSVKIDTTAPQLGPLRDGNASSDRDTVSDPNGTLRANWDSANDPHSKVVHYAYAIGKTPGDSNVLGWSNTPDTSSSASGLSLKADSNYFFSLRAFNKAELRSELSSDGMLVQRTTRIEEAKEDIEAWVAPNPFQDRFRLRWEGDLALENIRLFDIRGKQIPLETERKGDRTLRVEATQSSSSGVHFLWVECKNGRNSVFELLRQ